MRKLVLAFVLLTAAAPSFAQSHHHGGSTQTPQGPPIHNGNWWNNKSEIFRDGFMTGYKSGSLHAAGHPLDLNNFPANQLIDGLNHFYKDFRNLNVLVDDALAYTLDQLHGMPDDKLNAELLKLRAASAPTTQE